MQADGKFVLRLSIVPEDAVIGDRSLGAQSV